MENAADALRMVAGLLIFIVSLSICINAFGEVRQTSEIILNYQDREYDQTYVLALKDDTGRPITERTVGAESIIPTIYKAYKENYKIVFTENALEGGCLYTKNGEKVYRIDLQNDLLGNNEQKERFIKALMNGEDKEYFSNQGIDFGTETLFSKIKNKRFKEYLGVYYQEELQGETETPDINKTQKKVITYDKLI